MFRLGMLMLLSGFSFHSAKAQCSYQQVTHTAGTQTVGCAEVEVSSSGAILTGYFTNVDCQYGPFYLGNGASGEFTFNFSPPINGVRINVTALDYYANAGKEEMVLTINGVFYPFTSAGLPDVCFNQAVVSPIGTLRANPIYERGSAKDIDINTSISTLKIASNMIDPNPVGFFVSLYLCCPVCETDAGQLSAGPLSLCADQPAVLPPAGQTVLDANDLLQYILFTDPSNATGSILATSNGPTFPFNPMTMSLGTTYYIAAIAGNDIGGNVDLNDFCLSISNQVPVVWFPLPTVAFISGGDCFQAGGCYDISLNFTGTPPFQLTGQVLSGSSVVTTFSGTYNLSSETMLLCLPAATPAGPITVEALSLTDAHCTCN